MYTLVTIDSTPDGCHRLDTDVVEDAAAAAKILMERGVYPWHALLIEGERISEDYDDNNPLWIEFNKLHQAAMDAAELKDYLRLKKKFENNDQVDTQR